MTTITLLGKPGCCLCDDARRAVEGVRAKRRLALEEVDVSLDPALHRRYGERIPVLLVDGEEAFELGVDVEALEERLDSMGA
jgi:glutaredoxin